MIIEYSLSLDDGDYASIQVLDDETLSLKILIGRPFVDVADDDSTSITLTLRAS